MSKKAQVLSFFDLPFRPLNKNVTSRIVSGEHLMFVEHQVKKGHVAIDDSHINEQFTLVLKGAVKFTLEGESHILKNGDALLIPSQVVHTCEVLEDSIVIEVFSPPRTEWLNESR